MGFSGEKSLQSPVIGEVYFVNEQTSAHNDDSDDNDNDIYTASHLKRVC